MFKVTDNKGFHVEFENGWTVSVQWGRGNYCDNYNFSDGPRGGYGGPVPPSEKAEIAAWDSNGGWFKFNNGDTFNGYLTADEVFKFINKVRKFERT